MTKQFHNHLHSFPNHKSQKEFRSIPPFSKRGYGASERSVHQSKTKLVTELEASVLPRIPYTYFYGHLKSLWHSYPCFVMDKECIGEIKRTPKVLSLFSFRHLHPAECAHFTLTHWAFPVPQCIDFALAGAFMI